MHGRSKPVSSSTSRRAASSPGFIGAVERTGDALPVARMVRPLDQQHLQCRRVDDDEDGLGNLEGRASGMDVSIAGEPKKTRRAGWSHANWRSRQAAAPALRRRMCSSRSCFSSTLLGRVVSRHWARCVLGRRSRRGWTRRRSSASRGGRGRRPGHRAAARRTCSASSRKPNLMRWSPRA